MVDVPTHTKYMALLSALENVTPVLFTIQVSYYFLNFLLLYWHIVNKIVTVVEYSRMPLQ
jgi:hypothetical protein